MGIFDEHIREQDSRECRACGKIWPCETIDEAAMYRCTACQHTLEQCDAILASNKRACCNTCGWTDTHGLPKKKSNKAELRPDLETKLVDMFRTFLKETKLLEHPCPACGMDFTTPDQVRDHYNEEHASERCCPHCRDL